MASSGIASMVSMAGTIDLSTSVSCLWSSSSLCCGASRGCRRRTSTGTGGSGTARSSWTLGQHLAGYEQHHRLLLDYNHDDEWDGVAIQRFESREAFDAFMADPAFAERVIPDQDEFIDMDRVVWFLSEPPDVFV